VGFQLFGYGSPIVLMKEVIGARLKQSKKFNASSMSISNIKLKNAAKRAQLPINHNDTLG